MATGKFDYTQYKLRSIADEIIEAANNEAHVEASRWMIQTAEVLTIGSIMLNRVDNLLTREDDAESFVKRVEEELRQARVTTDYSNIKEQLAKAIELLSNAECVGDTYVDLSSRSKWKRDKEELLASV